MARPFTVLFMLAAAAYAGDSPEQQILVARMAERDLRIARGATPALARGRA